MNPKPSTGHSEGVAAAIVGVVSVVILGLIVFIPLVAAVVFAAVVIVRWLLP